MSIQIQEGLEESVFAKIQIRLPLLYVFRAVSLKIRRFALRMKFPILLSTASSLVSISTRPLIFEIIVALLVEGQH